MPVRLTRRRLSAAVATTLTLAAVTAFGVAPIDEASLPPATLIRETPLPTDAAVVTSDAALFEHVAEPGDVEAPTNASKDIP